LKGDKAGFWRYRIGDYRVLCDIQNKHVVVLVLTIGHRRQVYRKR
jgi:mRNA interferase RelE/StbE